MMVIRLLALGFRVRAELTVQKVVPALVQYRGVDDLEAGHSEAVEA